jgi:hypothetical protein
MIRVGLPIQIGILVLATLAPFFFPTGLTATLAFLSALIFPPMALVLGILMDLLYLPGNSWPLATLAGAVVCLFAIAVRSFVKARIM